MLPHVDFRLTPEYADHPLCHVQTRNLLLIAPIVGMALGCLGAGPQLGQGLPMCRLVRTGPVHRHPLYA